MIDPKKFVVGDDAQVSDIDLDEEVFVLPDGHRLTERLADELEARETVKTRAGRAANLVPGRKSLSGDGSHSPVLQVRLPSELHARVRERAAAEHVSASRLTREALERYLAS